MGGYDITRDIEQIGISLAYAEQLKCKYGMASPELVEVNHRFRIPSPTQVGGEVAVMATELAEIIASRLDQIVKPLLEMLNKEASRFQILYVTGGGAMLQGIIEYLQARTPIQVMYGSHASWLAEDTEEDMYMPSYSALVGTLLLGANYREKHPMATSNGKGRLIDEITNTLAKKTLEIFSDQNY
jgi:cell division ATPase FtsA